MTDSSDRPATLARVAEAAGVSLKTASRVFNGEPHVTPRTRDRVLEAARALDFQINSPASMLKRGIGSAGVALIVGDISNPFFSALARGVESETRSRGGFLTLASSDESVDEEKRLVDEFLRRHVQGIVLSSTLAEHSSLDFIRARGTALVFVDRPPVGIEADSVLLDNEGGARAATEHLLAHGHRAIAFVGDYGRLATHRERMRGFADAMTAAGVSDWRSAVHEGAHDADSARELVTRILRGPNPPTAILASNNRIAIGAISAIRALGAQTALIGIDDFDLADVLGVTTVSHDPGEMGRIAAERLFTVSPNPLLATEPHRVVLPLTLVPRGSGEIAPTS
jgi:LacI family transcriptional regulator